MNAGLQIAKGGNTWWSGTTLQANKVTAEHAARRGYPLWATPTFVAGWGVLGRHSGRAMPREGYIDHVGGLPCASAYLVPSRSTTPLFPSPPRVLVGPAGLLTRRGEGFNAPRILVIRLFAVIAFQSRPIHTVVFVAFKLGIYRT